MKSPLTPQAAQLLRRIDSLEKSLTDQYQKTLALTEQLKRVTGTLNATLALTERLEQTLGVVNDTLANAKKAG